MISVTFPYQSQPHTVWGTVNRPFIALHFYSSFLNQWFTLNNILVDTGSDISVLPLQFGEILVADVQAGEPISLRHNVAKRQQFNAFLHRVQAQIGQTRFEMPVAIAMSLVPPIFGRQDALDRFSAHFIKGQNVILEID